MKEKKEISLLMMFIHTDQEEICFDTIVKATLRIKINLPC